MARLDIKFELAPEKYWNCMSHEEIRLYLFSLNIDGKTDWRVPTNYELTQLKGICWQSGELVWYSEAVLYFNEHTKHGFSNYKLIPVRDKP
jgi:hypothetical protein